MLIMSACVGLLAVGLLTLNRKMGITVATQAENQAKIDAVATQLNKAKEEIIEAIEDLKAQADQGQELDFSSLDSAAQTLDDINPDAVVEPTPEVDPFDEDNASETGL